MSLREINEAVGSLRGVTELGRYLSTALCASKILGSESETMARVLSAMEKNVNEEPVVYEDNSKTWEELRRLGD